MRLRRGWHPFSRSLDGQAGWCVWHHRGTFAPNLLASGLLNRLDYWIQRRGTKDYRLYVSSRNYSTSYFPCLFLFLSFSVTVCGGETLPLRSTEIRVHAYLWPVCHKTYHTHLTRLLSPRSHFRLSLNPVLVMSKSFKIRFLLWRDKLHITSFLVWLSVYLYPVYHTHSFLYAFFSSSVSACHSAY